MNEWREGIVERTEELASETYGPETLARLGVRIPTTTGHLSLSDRDKLAGIGAVTGQSGAGKSVVLDVARRYAIEDGSFVVPNDTTPPDTSTLLDIEDYMESVALAAGPVDRWAMLWRSVLLSSLTSVLFSADGLGLQQPAAAKERHLLESELVPSLARQRVVHPFRLAKDMASTPIDIQNPAWDELEQLLTQHLSNTKVEVFLDGMDSAADNGPAIHHQFQAGLVTAVGRLTHGSLQHNYRVGCAVPKSVLHHTRRRRLAEPLELHWDSRSLEEMLALTLFDSDDCSAFASHVASLLALDTVRNPERGESTEAVWPYILRHSSGVPRDALELLGAGMRAALRHGEGSESARSEGLRSAIGPRAFNNGEALLYDLGTAYLATIQHTDTSRFHETLGRSIDDQLLLWARALGGEFTAWSDLDELTTVAFELKPAEMLRLAIEQRILGRHETSGDDPEERPTVVYDGRLSDPTVATQPSVDLCLNSCLLEVAGVRVGISLAPEAIFQ